MFMEERQREIAARIYNEGKITIAQITEKYGISDESARRDLRILESRGECKRTHGGAIRMQQVSVRPPEDRDFSTMPIFDNYREIAREAASYIRQNDIIYLTGGSFGYIMLRFLPREFHYTLVVNSIDIGKELRAWENIDVYIAGGKMRSSGTVVDTLATEFVSRIHFDTCFITGGGLTAEFGLSNGTNETASFQRAVIQNSRKRILLIPGAKVGCDSFIKVCGAEQFHIMITDWECTEEQISLLEEKGLNVVTVCEGGRKA